MTMCFTVLGVLVFSYWLTRMCVRLDGGKW